MSQHVKSLDAGSLVLLRVGSSAGMTLCSCAPYSKVLASGALLLSSTPALILPLICAPLSPLQELFVCQYFSFHHQYSQCYHIHDVLQCFLPSTLKTALSAAQPLQSMAGQTQLLLLLHFILRRTAASFQVTEIPVTQQNYALPLFFFLIFFFRQASHALYLDKETWFCFSNYR